MLNHFISTTKLASRICNNHPNPSLHSQTLMEHKPPQYFVLEGRFSFPNRPAPPYPACCKIPHPSPFAQGWNKFGGVPYKVVYLPHHRRKASHCSCYPPCLGVTRGDHVLWPAMENMIPTMMMINMSTDGSSAAPLIHLYSYKSTKAHHIQASQCM
jgi:hypothetical protein